MDAYMATYLPSKKTPKKHEQDTRNQKKNTDRPDHSIVKIG